MSLAIPLPLSARRTRRQTRELAREAAMPLEKELPASVLVRDAGEERAVKDAWAHCGRQVLTVVNRSGTTDYSRAEYNRVKSDLIGMSVRPPGIPLRPYEVTDKLAILAMAQFSLEPPYEHPLIDMDRQLVGAMLKEQYPQTFAEHVTM